MVAKEPTHSELGEMLAHIVERMATKDDLNDLADKVDNIAGYRKEIDHAFERIAVIEKHLGINRKIAAYPLSPVLACPSGRALLAAATHRAVSGAAVR